MTNHQRLPRGVAKGVTMFEFERLRELISDKDIKKMLNVEWLRSRKVALGFVKDVSDLLPSVFRYLYGNKGVDTVGTVYTSVGEKILIEFVYTDWGHGYHDKSEGLYFNRGSVDDLTDEGLWLAVDCILDYVSNEIDSMEIKLKKEKADTISTADFKALVGGFLKEKQFRGALKDLCPRGVADKQKYLLQGKSDIVLDWVSRVEMLIRQVEAYIWGNGLVVVGEESGEYIWLEFKGGFFEISDCATDFYGGFFNFDVDSFNCDEDLGVWGMLNAVMDWLPTTINMLMERDAVLEKIKSESKEKEFERAYRDWKLGAITAVAAMKRLGVKKTTFYQRVKEFEKANPTLCKEIQAESKESKVGSEN
jgi:hypothetical protein